MLSEFGNPQGLQSCSGRFYFVSLSRDFHCLIKQSLEATFPPSVSFLLFSRRKKRSKKRSSTMNIYARIVFFASRSGRSCGNVLLIMPASTDTINAHGGEKKGASPLDPSRVMSRRSDFCHRHEFLISSLGFEIWLMIPLSNCLCAGRKFPRARNVLLFVAWLDYERERLAIDKIYCSQRNAFAFNFITLLSTLFLESIESNRVCMLDSLKLLHRREDASTTSEVLSASRGSSCSFMEHDESVKRCCEWLTSTERSRPRYSLV